MSKSFLRIRPIDGFSSKNENSTFFKSSDNRIECKPPANSQCMKNEKSKESKKKIFEFDKILDENCEQEQIYEDCVQPLLNQFFDGQNVLLFAYGTTSSGKTHTMRGDSNNPGVIPRCINDIFKSMYDKVMTKPLYKKSRFNEYTMLNEIEMKKEEEIKFKIINSIDNNSISLNDSKFKSDELKSFFKDDKDFRHIVWTSFLEFYNEISIDLLSVNSSSSTNLFGSNSQSSTTERNVSLKVMRDLQQNFFVNGLTQVYVDSAEEAMKVYLYGIKNLKKHISKTAMNQVSSRSHSIFTITVITLKANCENDFIHVNNFSLCDLAGQERSKNTQTTGIHLKEACLINKSIFALKRTIQVIKQNYKNSSNLERVPFTESVLTKVFKPYLTGVGLTTVIICLNPNDQYYDETINTLEFSATASHVVKTESSNSLNSKMLNGLKKLFAKKLSTTIQDFTFNQTAATFASNNLTNDFVNLKTNNHHCKMINSTAPFKLENLDNEIIEMEMYDAEAYEELKSRYEKLEKEIENADRNKENEFRLIYEFIEKIYCDHEVEKSKIRERMENLMEQRMDMLKNEHKYEIDDFEKEIEDLLIQLKSNENKLKLYEQNSEIDFETINELKKELEEIKRERDQMDKEYESKLDHKDKEIEQLKVDCKNLKAQIELIKKEKDQMYLENKAHLDKKDQEIVQLNVDNQNLKSQIELIKKENESKLDDNDKEIEQLKVEYKNSKAQIELIKRERDQMNRENKFKLDDKDKKIEKLNVDNENLKSQIKKIKHEKDQLEIKSKAQLDNRDEKISQLNADNENLKVQFESLREEQFLNQTSKVVNSTQLKKKSQSTCKKRSIDDDDIINIKSTRTRKKAKKNDSEIIDDDEDLSIFQVKNTKTARKSTRNVRKTKSKTESKNKSEIIDDDYSFQEEVEKTVRKAKRSNPVQMRKSKNESKNKSEIIDDNCSFQKEVEKTIRKSKRSKPDMPTETKKSLRNKTRINYHELTKNNLL